ncbi:ERMES complex subunit mmm1 [Ceratobasidium sp. 414]|nr:ERMES complex subunit mmm1 [Ceratobasidium sp. 414]
MTDNVTTWELGNMALFSMTPTFTQGLVLGQLSIFLLLVVIIRYLFLDSAKSPPVHTPAPLPPARTPVHGVEKENLAESDWKTGDAETAEWFNLVLQMVAQTYREEVKGNLQGPAGEEAARIRIENWLNTTLQSDILVSIKPPSPTAIAPSITLSLAPHFHLELNTTSLLGSRAKLADVPKIHQMIEERIRRAIADRATWKFMLPGLAARTAREGLPDTLI